MAASRTGAGPRVAAERPSDGGPPASGAVGLVRPRSPWKAVVRSGVSLAVVAGIFYGLLRNTDLAEVGDALAEMTALELSGLVLVTVWNTVTYWLVLQSALPGLTLPQAAISSTTSTAVANTVPGGAAFGVVTTTAMYASWGVPGPAIARAVVVTGVWNTFVKLGMPIVALAILAVTDEAGAGLVTAAFCGVVVLALAVGVFALMLRSDELARRVGHLLTVVANRALRVVRRGPVPDWAAAAVRFRRDTIGLLHERWVPLTVFTLISHISLYVVLLVALRDVGVSEQEVSWAEVLGAFTFVRLLTALPVTPGGVGVVELGLTAALVVGGGDQAQVVAAVLVFRGLTYLLPVPFGALTYVMWRRQEHRDRGRSPDAAQR
jgi:putative heme transporter